MHCQKLYSTILQTSSAIHSPTQKERENLPVRDRPWGGKATGVLEVDGADRGVDVTVVARMASGAAPNHFRPTTQSRTKTTPAPTVQQTGGLQVRQHELRAIPLWQTDQDVPPVQPRGEGALWAKLTLQTVPPPVRTLGGDIPTGEVIWRQYSC